jgi:hypothetical protein
MLKAERSRGVVADGDVSRRGTCGIESAEFVCESLAEGLRAVTG